MRLGLWNRLALVSTVSFTLIWPTWSILSSNAELARTLESGYSSCIQRVGKPGSDLTHEFCRKSWLEEHSYAGWTEWAMTVAAAALLSLIVYLLAALIVWVAKWVWRGRERQA